MTRKRLSKEAGAEVEGERESRVGGLRRDGGQIRMPRKGEMGGEGWGGALGSLSRLAWKSAIGGTEARKRARVPGLQMVRRRCGGVRLALPLLYRWHCTKYDTLNYLTADGGGRTGGTGWDLKDGGRGEPVEICRRQGGGGME